MGTDARAVVGTVRKTAAAAASVSKLFIRYFIVPPP
jgi:hypothetical protein